MSGLADVMTATPLLTDVLAPLADPLSTIPPFAWLFVATFVALFAPRSVGHAVGAVATALVGIQAFAVPDGTHVESTFLGFEVVLLNVDPASRIIAVGIGIIGTAAVLYSWGSEAPKV